MDQRPSPYFQPRSDVQARAARWDDQALEALKTQREKLRSQLDALPSERALQAEERALEAEARAAQESLTGKCLGLCCNAAVIAGAASCASACQWCADAL